MTVDIVLYNTKVYTKGAIVDGGIAINDGRIVRIAKEQNLPPASKKINLNGLLALPGLIDAHVHLRDQLLAYKEDFSTGTAAAVAGGIATVLDMPNNKPTTMNPISLKERMRVAEHAIIANVGFFSAFPNRVDRISQIVKEGAVGFKLYLASQIGGLDVDDDKTLLDAFKKAGELDVPVAVHAEDKKIIETLMKEEKRCNRKDISAYLRVHTPEVEVKAVERILRIAQKTALQLHFCHISSKKAVSFIQEARRNGLSVSCEVTPHHLLLTSEDLIRSGNVLLTDPPWRNKDVVEYLWKVIKRSWIDIVSTDHAPHLVKEKRAESIWNVKPGIPGLETLLPLLLTQVNENRLTIDELVTLTSEKPAEIFHLKSLGSLKVGYDANITIVDMNRQGKIQADGFHSRAKYSPFEGWRVKGLPVMTFVNGKLAMDDGEIIARGGTGRIIAGGD